MPRNRNFRPRRIVPVDWHYAGASPAAVYALMTFALTGWRRDACVKLGLTDSMRLNTLTFTVILTAASLSGQVPIVSAPPGPWAGGPIVSAPPPPTGPGPIAPTPTTPEIGRASCSAGVHF